MQNLFKIVKPERFPVNFSQSWKRTNELNEVLFWYNYGKSLKTLKKYADKICENMLSAEMFLEIQNTGWILFASALKWTKRKWNFWRLSGNE